MVSQSSVYKAHHNGIRRHSPSLLLKHLPSLIRNLLVHPGGCIDADLLLSGRESWKQYQWDDIFALEGESAGIQVVSIRVIEDTPLST